jgi:hypothetical protein
MTVRLGEVRLKEVLPVLLESAAEVSHRLGWGER